MATANGGDGVLRPRARESEGETGESEREQGGVASSRASSEEGRPGKQASRWRGAVARARRPHSPPSVEDEDDRGGRRAGPPAGWAGQLAGLHREEPR